MYATQCHARLVAHSTVNSLSFWLLDLDRCIEHVSSVALDASACPIAFLMQATWAQGSSETWACATHPRKQTSVFILIVILRSVLREGRAENSRA
jgi:hypothetical protein